MKFISAIGLVCLGLVGTSLFAATEVRHINKYVATFTENDARDFSLAFGLDNPLSGSFEVANVPGLYFQGSVRGTAGGNGQTSTHYTGRFEVDIDDYKLVPVDGKVSFRVKPQFGDEVYHALKGLKETTSTEDGVETKTRSLTTQKFSLVCSFTDGGFIPYACDVTLVVAARK